MATGGVAKRRSCGAALARLAGEAQEALKKPNDGIWSKPVCDDDLMNWESLVLGPALSPYAFGFFTFRIQFPEEYPSCAPHVTFLTTGGGKTRFNPNLYADGKVCLSILGTWRGESGEQWSSVQNCQSLMVSIQVAHNIIIRCSYCKMYSFFSPLWMICHIIMSLASRKSRGNIHLAAGAGQLQPLQNLPRSQRNIT
mmetsp:Transcript_28068/g.74049  ORF Transcript_28068/g.74049 Transcript_28068/m.74049 type:complete len:197 (+) Transcript_28068:102-692(+)